MSESITVFSVDDQPPLLRDGLATVINAQPDMRLIGQASSGREAIETFRQHDANVTLMDLKLPDMSAIDAMNAIHAEFPNAPCIIFSTFGYENDIRRALAEGARAYILPHILPSSMGFPCAATACAGVRERGRQMPKCKSQVLCGCPDPSDTRR